MVSANPDAVVHTLRIQHLAIQSVGGSIKPFAGIGYWHYGQCQIVNSIQLNLQLIHPPRMDLNHFDIPVTSEQLSWLSLIPSTDDNTQVPVNCVALKVDFQGKHLEDTFRLEWDASQTQVQSTIPSITKINAS